MDFLQNFTSELIVHSPGRINLIGEHTDYNMGYVLPTAIEKKIRFQFQKNGSASQCRIYSKTYDNGFEFDLNAISRSETEWENYLLGVINEIFKRIGKSTHPVGNLQTETDAMPSKAASGSKENKLLESEASQPMGASRASENPQLTCNTILGFDCILESDLPTGSGLSSSAALECGMAFGLNELFDLGLSKIEMVQLSQTAEHTYVGTECGIMDQFASVMSQSGKVILLDCKSLDYDFIPINLHPYKIILLNTKVSHNLASSEYNTRKRECEIGVKVIRRKYPNVKSLRDVTEAMLTSCKEDMDGIVYNRCSFIVSENNRVLEMAHALRDNDLITVGQLLYAAHHGLSKLYETSCIESDFLVDYTQDNPAVLGARQTGGGFGGCTLNIVHGEECEKFIENTSKAYKKKFNIDLDAFEVKPSGGTLADRL